MSILKKVIQFQYLKCLSLYLVSAQNGERNALLCYSTTNPSAFIFNWGWFFLSSDFTSVQRAGQTWPADTNRMPQSPHSPLQAQKQPCSTISFCTPSEFTVFTEFTELSSTLGHRCSWLCLYHTPQILPFWIITTRNRWKPTIVREDSYPELQPWLRAELPCSLRSRKSPKGLSKNLVIDFWSKSELSYQIHIYHGKFFIRHSYTCLDAHLNPWRYLFWESVLVYVPQKQIRPFHVHFCPSVCMPAL